MPTTILNNESSAAVSANEDYDLPDDAIEHITQQLIGGCTGAIPDYGEERLFSANSEHTNRKRTLERQVDEPFLATKKQKGRQPR